MNLGRIGAAALVGGGIVVGAPGGARAQTLGADATTATQSPQNFAFEVRVGAYQPNIDAHFTPRTFCPDATTGTPTLTSTGPFYDIFSTRNTLPSGHTPSACDPRGIPLHPLFAAEFDWQIVRLGPIGSFGIGASVGFATLSAQAPTQASMSVANFGQAYAATAPPTGCTATADSVTNPNCWVQSAESTTLDVIPVTALAVFRLDGLARRIPWLPIVPYVKAGLNYSFYMIYKGPNLSTGNCMSSGTTTCSSVVGGQLGWHGALGVAVMLDAFEPRTARQLDTNSGINHTYFFGEIYTDQMFLVGHSATPFDIGTHGLGPFTWTFGLTFEF